MTSARLTPRGYEDNLRTLEPSNPGTPDLGTFEPWNLGTF
jgi:hypothetical protein